MTRRASPQPCLQISLCHWLAQETGSEGLSSHDLRRRTPVHAPQLVQWAEKVNADGSRDKWGDKWEERFKDGSGSKTVRVGLPGWVCVLHLSAPLGASLLAAAPWF